ncbi:hypothetical protein BDF19DRAFT_109285 [Syncephalis fuscata]|nr:hypothetical protein BDF19DRAFT_109285 [Syncephalis fuscata]
MILLPTSYILHILSILVTYVSTLLQQQQQQQQQQQPTVMVTTKKRVATGMTNIQPPPPPNVSGEELTLDAVIEILQTRKPCHQDMIKIVEQQLLVTLSTAIVKNERGTTSKRGRGGSNKSLTTTTTATLARSKGKTLTTTTTTPLGQQGPLLASYAMRLANACIQILNTYATQSSEQQQQNTQQQSIVVSIGVSTVKALFILDDYNLVSLTGIELMRAIGSLLGKCVDRGEYQSSLDMLYQLRDRLTSIVLDTEIVDPSIKPTSSNSHGTIYIPIPRTSNYTNYPITMPMVIIHCQLNIMRCWIGLEYLSLLETTINETILCFTDKQTIHGSCFDWLYIAMKVEKSTTNTARSTSVTAFQLADILFRELYRMSSKLQTIHKASPMRILQLRLMALRSYLLNRPLFDFNTFCDYITRFAALFERSTRSAVPGSELNKSALSVLIQFHDQLLDWIERELATDQLVITSTYATWCEYHLYTARKTKQWEGALRNVHILIKLSMQPISSSSSNDKDSEVILPIYTIRFLLEAAKLRWHKEANSVTVTKYISKAMSITWPLFDNINTISSHLSTAVHKLIESIEGLCHLIGEFPDNLLDSALVKTMAVLLDKCLNLLSAFYSNKIKDRVTSSISLISTAIHNIFRRVIRYHAISFQLLDQANQLLKTYTSDVEDADWIKISAAYYNVGGRLYKAKEIVWAEKAMSMSCQLLESTIKRCNHHSTNTDRQKQLGKQLELLTACQCVHGHFEDAQHSLMTAIRYWPMDEIRTFNERIVDWIGRWIDIGLTSLANVPYTFIYRQLAVHSDFTDPLTLATIKKIEWRLLCQYQKRDTLELQLSIVNELLSDYSINNHPIEHARKGEGFTPTNKECSTFRYSKYDIGSIY